MKYSILFVLFFSITTVSQAQLSTYLSSEINNPSRSGQEAFEVWLVFDNTAIRQQAIAISQEMNLSLAERHRRILTLLQSHHQQHMQWVKQEYPELDVSDSYWLNSSMVFKTNRETLLELIEEPEVSWIELTEERHAPIAEYERVPDVNASRSPSGTEPGLLAVNAHKMWQRGYTGRGRKALIVDTGIWEEHPSLSDGWLGNRKPLSEVWYGFDSQKPRDKGSSHGTHVCGTVMGLDPATNDTIGMAFNAQFLASDPVASGDVSNIKQLYHTVKAFEWAMNPDGDINTHDDVPDAINNSWGRGTEDLPDICTDPFADAVELCQIAGMAVIWSAGNNGPDTNTIGAPATITKSPYFVFTVGAVSPHDTTYPVAGFSSRGPSYCATPGIDSIKPEVVAPGVSIRSAVDKNGYASYQGTSMASPHVTGAILLLKEAFPQLSGEQLMEALYLTAKDLGVAGEDIEYGNGFIDVDSAFLWLSQQYTSASPNLASTDVSLELLSRDTLSIVCSETMSATVGFVNETGQTIPSGTLLFRQSNYNGSTVSYSSNSAINSGDTARVNVSVQPNFSGPSGAEFALELPYDTMGYAFNNTAVVAWDNLSKSTLPFEDDFSSGLNQWIVENPDEDLTWNTKHWEVNGVRNASLQLEFNKMLGGVGQYDGLYSPQLDLSSAPLPQLSFDYAYTSKFAPVFKDSLFIELSADCGATWDTIFADGGASLQTRSDTNGVFIPKNASEWEQAVISLEAYDAISNAVFRFSGKNALGNNLYIDNLRVGSAPYVSVSSEQGDQEVTVFPNPSKGKVMVTAQDHISHFELREISGKQVLTKAVKEGSRHVTFDTVSIPKGMYFLVVEGDGWQYIAPLVVQ